MVSDKKRIGIYRKDIVQLERLQERTNLSHAEIISKAVTLYERHLVYLQIRDDFESLSDDPELLKEYNEMSDSLGS
jgi:hypothetical protein